MNATIFADSSIPTNFGRWLRLSLAIHVLVICGVFFVTPFRHFFIYSINSSRISAEKTAVSSLTSSFSELQERLERALGSALKNPKDDNLLEVKKSAEALFLSAQASEQKFYQEQIKELAAKLGITTSEAEKLIPFKEKHFPNMDEVIAKIQRSAKEDPVTLRASIEDFSKTSTQITAEAEQKQQMAMEAARGETPLDHVSVEEQEKANMREGIRKMLERAAADSSRDIHDFTDAMRSYYGTELAPGRTPKSFRAAIDDAAPGRVQVTQTGLIPPPLLDKKWLASVYTGRNIVSFPAGRISSDANFTRSGPLFLDSWYILGPWPLNNEQDFFKSFLPENKVDLDAEYIGKGGRKLRWQFVQSKEPLVDLPLQVPDSTTYAFSTLDFAQEQAAWMICGADDRMKLWINGLPIFGSLASLKGWHIGNEGIRKVLFRAGRNDVLVRIDNLPGFTRFSIVLLPPDFENKTILQ